MSEAMRERILDAATAMFSRHGYRRASMELIAQQAQVSKPTIYAHFEGKEGLFVGVCRRLGNSMVEQARVAAAVEAPLPQRVADVLAAKFAPLFVLVDSSPHAHELLHPQSEAAQASIDCADRDFRDHLGQVLRAAAEAGELDLSACGMDAEALTSRLMQIGYGASYGAATVDEHGENLRGLVALVLR